MPVSIDPEVQDEILEYLGDELETALDERQVLEAKWAKWKRQREGRPAQLVKNKPWPNASNVTVPAASIATNAIAGALKQSFADRKPFWTFSSDRDDEEVQMQAMTEFIETLADSPFHLNLKAKLEPLFYDTASMGTKFAKIVWNTQTKKYWVENPDGSKGQATVNLRSGVEIVPIPIQDFACRAIYDNLQEAPWIAHAVHHTWFHLAQMAEQGLYDRDAVDAISEWYDTHSDPTDQRVDDESDTRWGLNPKWGEGKKESQSWKLWEFWFDWIMPDDDTPSALKFLVEPRSMTILRMDLNDLAGRRPFVRIPYIIREGRLYAQGVGWKAEPLQDEMDTMHNLRVDGLHISVAPMLGVKKHSGVGPKETVRPGKLWFTDNPREDLNPLALNAPQLQFSIAAESLAQQYLDRDLGTSDAMLGFADTIEKTRASVGGRAMQLQQGAARFRGIVEGIEPSISEIGLYVYMQLVRNREAVRQMILGLSEEKQDAIMTALSIPLDQVSERLRVQVKTTDVEETEDAKRQSMLMIIQLSANFWQQLLQASMIVDNPQVPAGTRQIAAEQIVAITTRMKEVLEGLNEDFLKKKLPDIRRYEQMLAQAAAQLNAIEAIRNMRAGAVNAALGGGTDAFNLAGGVQSQLNGGGGSAGADADRGVGGVPEDAADSFGFAPEGAR